MRISTGLFLLQCSYGRAVDENIEENPERSVEE
jgi:hypothetical protein